MKTDNRPLSPHLQVYRWQWTMAYSIFHRITGVALGVGTLLLTWWLLALASGPESFAVAQDFIGSFIGRLLLFGWTFALFYHLCNGIRHLGWDMGLGFELNIAGMTGHLSVAAAAVLSLASWAIAYSAM